MATTKQPTGHGPTDRKAATNETLAKTKPAAQRIRVRATRTGYYEHIRRREGDVFDLIPQTGVRLTIGKSPTGRTIQVKTPFTLTADQQFSEMWMEEVHPRTALGTSSSQDEIRRQHDELLALKAPPRMRNVGDPTEGDPGDEDPGRAELPPEGNQGSGTGDQDPLGSGS